jgi:hypothetical protein
MTQCSVVVGYQRFIGPLHREDEGRGISEMLVSYNNTTRPDNPEDHDLNLHPEDGGIMEIRNVGILLQHYKVSKPRSPRNERHSLILILCFLNFLSNVMFSVSLNLINANKFRKVSKT